MTKSTAILVCQLQSVEDSRHMYSNKGETQVRDYGYQSCVGLKSIVCVTALRLTRAPPSFSFGQRLFLARNCPERYQKIKYRTTSYCREHEYRMGQQCKLPGEKKKKAHFQFPQPSLSRPFLPLPKSVPPIDCLQFPNPKGNTHCKLNILRASASTSASVSSPQHTSFNQCTQTLHSPILSAGILTTYLLLVTSLTSSKTTSLKSLPSPPPSPISSVFFLLW